MILKINGVPVEEIVKEGIDVGLNMEDVYHLIHVPVVTDFHWFAADVNLFNLPHHIYHGISSLL